jgi:transposase
LPGRLFFRLKLWPALWTFADVPDVEPTNNAAEPGLRAAVIYRKLSLGSRSQGGERTIERLLSVDQTADCNAGGSSATSRTRSPPKPAATLSPRSPDGFHGALSRSQDPSASIKR